MSPASYQTAPPRTVMLRLPLLPEVPSNRKSGKKEYYPHTPLSANYFSSLHIVYIFEREGGGAAPYPTLSRAKVPLAMRAVTRAEPSPWR